MKVRCLYNTGKALRPYEYDTSLTEKMAGRFGATAHSEYNELEIGKEYLVMGIITHESYLAYLVDDGGTISSCPCQLFEVIDDKLPPNWHFRLVEKDEDIYPFIQGLCGYYELCADKKSYEKMVVDWESEARLIFFKRKIELEKYYEELE